MIEKVEISKKEYEQIIRGVNFYDSKLQCAIKYSEKTIWPYSKYGVFAPDVFMEDDKYFVTWAHKVHMNERTAYEYAI